MPEVWVLIGAIDYTERDGGIVPASRSCIGRRCLRRASIYPKQNVVSSVGPIRRAEGSEDGFANDRSSATEEDWGWRFTRPASWSLKVFTAQRSTPHDAQTGPTEPDPAWGVSTGTALEEDAGEPEVAGVGLPAFSAPEQARMRNTAAAISPQRR